MTFMHAFEQLREGNVMTYGGTQVRLVTNQTSFNGEVLETTHAFEHKDKDGWKRMNALNTECILNDGWEVA